MPGVEVNWWAVLAAAVFNVAAGSLWFTASGKSSRKLTAKRAGQLAAGEPGIWFIFLCSLAQAWILVHFVRYAGSLTFWQGAVTGFWLWLGLIAAAALVQHLFEGRGDRPWRTGVGFFLIVLVVDSGLLAAWR